MPPRIPFLALTLREDAAVVQRAIDRVIARGWFILGPEVEAFESEFAAAMGARHSVGVGTGTDAIALILRALGIGRGDEVITAPLSAAYSALAVMMVGARPVFADIDPDRLTLDPGQAARAVGPRTRAILPVHLYGQPADMAGIEAVAARHHLAIVEDCCQAHLATAGGRPVGTIGIAGAFSFYPTKNLAALGDGGAIVTGDRALADRVRRLRNGGQTDRYHHGEPGINSRLDELQAAVLRARLPFLPQWTARRRALAARYRAALAGSAPDEIDVPPEIDAGHVYHLFVVKVRGVRLQPDQDAAVGRVRLQPDQSARDDLQARLAATGIETLIHYPVAIPKQPALAGEQPAACPIAERVCNEILSLPLHPALTDADVDAVAAVVRKDTIKCGR
jgi:dTDP-4-amino-4,6-dideoxygalactose transaminase